MSSSKGFMLTLTLSAALHAGVAGALLVAPSQPPRQPGAEKEPIEIAFVQYTEKSVPKKIKGMPVPRQMAPKPMPPAQASEVVPAQPSDLELKFREKIKKQEAQLLKLSADTAVPTPKKTTQTSSELLTDPVKGKIFVGYFGSVKHMIQDLLVKKYAKKAIGHGSVYLYFVLNSKGELEKVSVVDRESTADEYLRELAIQCLREAAPFGTFPRSLQTDRISFNVTIYFEQQ